jgi:hypothetical protein
MLGVVEILLRIKDGIVNNISFLQSLINIKCEVSNLAINTDLSEIGDIYIDFKYDYENIEEQIEYLKNQTEKIDMKLKLALLCEHIFTTEEIDIDPDTSAQVCYCIKCEYSPRFY